jgi:hypothetical protein
MTENKTENIEIKQEVKQDENIIILNNFKVTVKKFFNTYNEKIITNLEVNKKISLLQNIINIDKKINNLNKLLKKINTV